MRARDKSVHRWKADRQVGHPVILAQMIGRAFYSTTASTDDIYLCICCQSTSDIHCYQDVKSIPWNITQSVSRAGSSNLPTLPLSHPTLLCKLKVFSSFATNLNSSPFLELKTLITLIKERELILIRLWIHLQFLLPGWK